MNRYPVSMANHLSAYGRYGDDQLVHMNSQEVAALDGIAAAFGRELTRNPHTGMKEAFNLFDILPIALNFIPGIGTAASIALSAASGAASSAIEGGNPLEGALMGGLTGAVGAGLGGGTADAAASAAKDVGAEALAKVPGVDAEMAKMMAMPAEQATKIATDAAAAQAVSGPLGGSMTDIFGAGTDAQLQQALAAPFKMENLPLTYMGMTALGSLPDMFGGGEAGGPEYKDIPENFPGAPRVVNPDYDPTMSAFGEQNAFSSGVNYGLPPLGYAAGGYVGYRNGGRVQPGKGPGGKADIPGEIPFNIQPRQRSIQPTNMNRMYAGSSPLFMSAPYTNIPLPGGQMGAPVGGGFSGMYQPDRSFEIATSPQGGPQQYNMPTSGGGMNMPQEGGKAGRRGGGQGGGKMAVTPQRMEQYAATAQSRPQEQRSMTQMSGAYDNLTGAQPDRSNINFLRNQLVGTPASKQEEQPQVNPGLQTGIMSTMSPGGAPGQASPQPNMMQMRNAYDNLMSRQTLPGAASGYAMGGMVDRAMEMDDRTVVKEAMAAIMGQSPNPEAAIAMFVDRFGEEALQMLMQKAQGGQQGRYIEGAGDGLSDSIPAIVDGQQPSALSTGEFVIPADAVSHLGNGDNKTGAKELYGMIDRLRQARTGSPTPPPAINQRGIMPA